MEIAVLSDKYEEQYEEFLLKNPKTLFFASNRYRHLLKKSLNCKDYYLLAIVDKKIVGVLPCFLKENKMYGNVLNSLPFYGSNGAIIEYENNYAVKDLLLSGLKQLCIDYSCVAYTIVTSPFETDLSYYRKESYDFVDSRIGMITQLPEYCMEIEQNLMSLFTSKQRNAIRKAKKLNVNVRIDNTKSSMAFLYKTHVDNMMQIGGKPKEKLFFDLVIELLNPDIDYNIYIAEHEGKLISALLVFYFNETVEYFTPVIDHEYRTYQSLGLIILNVMIDASRKKFKYFNWGGTGASQTGVYNFKKSFGSIEYPYFYFTNVCDKSILSLSKEVILKEYEKFFVFPFSN